VADRFTASIRSDDGVPVVELVGQIDADAETALLEAWDAAARDADRVVLDFGRTDYINSTGLAIIVQVLARARAERREVHAFGLTDHYREIFQITRLADFVTLHPDRAAALA
jgi:anti-anti-sigma factor